ncbi:hypothetical protein HYV86_01580 [Candidatus Woesearchaeota archaeon]|nr:hypothetical protein [Candidatus Woesearchaeota archaeon]
MSQIEQDFRLFLSKRPEIETAYQDGLINRRSLARYIIKQGVAKSNQMEAVIAMIRRYPFAEKVRPPKDFFNQIKIHIKDNIVILDFEKEKELVQKLQKLITTTNYDRGDTLKIVVGSSSVTVFLDEDNLPKIKDLLDNVKIKKKHSHISEISLLFPAEANQERGIVSTLTRELTMNNIVITEILTATSELLIYLNDDYTLKTYDLLKRLQKG